MLPAFPSSSTNSVVAMLITAGKTAVLINLDLNGLSP
jgi:hypothetical protein